jgi:tRNA(fMet)-specific endonuclease VapC
MILLDSDHVSVLIDTRDRRHAVFAKKLARVREPVMIPVVVLEEHLRGWLSQIRRIRDPNQLVGPYERLTRLLSFFAEWEIAAWNTESAGQFSSLRAARIRIGTQDLRIASMSLTHDATLLSANLRDFRQVPRLKVEDWLGT